jgi:hypothetical protein
VSECEVTKVNLPKFPPPELIVLTIEEAKELMKLLDLCEYWLTNNNVSYDCDAWASLLEERIEQAEGK